MSYMGSPQIGPKTDLREFLWEVILRNKRERIRKMR